MAGSAAIQFGATTTPGINLNLGTFGAASVPFAGSNPSAFVQFGTGGGGGTGPNDAACRYNRDQQES